MKINKHSDFMIKAFQDFLKANFGKTNSLAERGKFVLEVTDSQIKGSYINQGNTEKLKTISYQLKNK